MQNHQINIIKKRSLRSNINKTPSYILKFKPIFKKNKIILNSCKNYQANYEKKC